MKEVYSHEFNKWQQMLQKYLGMWRINRDSIDFKWGYFAPRKGFELMFKRGGYFDQQCSVNICLGWGAFNIKLPFKTKLKEGCILPRYGVSIHNNTFWLYMGGEYDNSLGQVTKDNNWTWYLPFFNWEFDTHTIFNNNGEWVNYQADYPSKHFDSTYQYLDNRKVKHYPFSYTLKNGTVQEREILVYKEKRTWHRKWFPFLKMTRISLDIKFNEEVGHKVGSYKGGVTGTSIEMLPDETFEDALKRFKVTRNL